MKPAEALFQARPLVDDLVATLGWERGAADDVVLEHLTSPTWREHDYWWLHHLVEIVQEQVQEDRIDTAWPQCPHHGGHPLWLQEVGEPDLWWSCRNDGERIARVGGLSAVLGRAVE